MNIFQFDFRTSYNQFYIADKKHTGDTGSKTFWTESAYNDRMAITIDLLAIGTESYGHIKGELHILEKESNPDFDKFDHIVEAGLQIESGILQFLDCPNSDKKLEIHIKPGGYRIRASSANLNTPYIDEDERDDYYRIEIWPSADLNKKILKRYTL